MARLPPVTRERVREDLRRIFDEVSSGPVKRRYCALTPSTSLIRCSSRHATRFDRKTIVGTPIGHGPAPVGVSGRVGVVCALASLP